MQRLFRLFSVQELVIFLILSITTIGLNNSWTNTYAENSTTNSPSQYNLTSEINSHNMSEMMQRGNIAMGFDQNKITHEFSSTKNGGQIKITALDEKDNQTISQIRNHTQAIQNDFAVGNFTKPFYIHSQSVPGTDDMSKNKDQIQYQIEDLKNGSVLSMHTNNSGLVSSIDQFMTYQSGEHTGH